MNNFPVTPSLSPALKIEHEDPPSLPSPPAGYGDFLLEIKTQIRQRQFQAFNEYADKPKLQSLIGEISWAKNLLIMGRCKDDLEREFHLRATSRFGWTKNVLQQL